MAQGPNRVQLSRVNAATVQPQGKRSKGGLFDSPLHWMQRMLHWQGCIGTGKCIGLDHCDFGKLKFKNVCVFYCVWN